MRDRMLTIRGNGIWLSKLIALSFWAVVSLGILVYSFITGWFFLGWIPLACILPGWYYLVWARKDEK